MAIILKLSKSIFVRFRNRDPFVMSHVPRFVGASRKNDSGFWTTFKVKKQSAYSPLTGNSIYRNPGPYRQDTEYWPNYHRESSKSGRKWKSRHLCPGIFHVAQIGELRLASSR